MALLTLEDVTVRFGRRAALDAVDLRIAEHEIVCVLGPSGSGKSTLLRVVAGLQPPDTGRVLLEDADQAGVPVHRRGVGLMFQDHQLFPQRDVGGNVAFGLRMRGESRGEQRRRVAELLDLVGLPGAERRAVATLSGGEQQRVALARALAPGPGCSCSTNHSASSTGVCESAWSWNCAASSRSWVRRCSPSRTIRAKPSRSPTGSW